MNNPSLTNSNYIRIIPIHFNPTTIKYKIPVRSTEYYSVLQNTFLKIYDVPGNEISTLVNNAQPPGNYIVEFNAENLPSGIYLYKFTASAYTQVRKMILLK
jgi:hypothetical protein